MSAKITLLFSLAFVLLFCKANAANITKLLNQYPDFSSFNDYLTRTGLATDISSRQTITVLVVDNGNISPLSGKSDAAIKKILSVHVILDYYDVKKLENLPNKTAILTTLYQSSGQATGQQGFLNVTDVSSGSVAIGSAEKGESLGANLVKSIASQPYNISLLQISTLIIPLGIDSTTSKNSTSPSPSPRPASSPKNSPSPKKSPPSDSPSPSKSPGSPPVPSDAPAADSPAHDSPNEGTTLQLSPFVMFIIVSSAVWLISTI
ncbi:fasciclin-like arabinogalactan protein 14 [Olea europaea var. sylvestris]|uniref:fasciclin-like arabinogalactan protein 14 n=1 Tax=Olea europaea var. sylvestris TaxID=158386 RepID=UPI000C1D3FD8|nr:fasciclin-like arabinogalactan protein 14 [Olea europaea var. sylvestris]